MIAKSKIALGVLISCALPNASLAASVTVSWDRSVSAGVIGYTVYVSLADGSNRVAHDVGNATNAIVDNLTTSQTYTFYATAYNTDGIFSDPSNMANYTVGGTNQPPTLSPIPNQVADEGKLLQFTATASDPDVGQTLSFSLGNAPAGASIGKTSGVFSWTPQSSQAPSSNTVTVVATDNGQPPLSASRSFGIVVREGFYLSIGTSSYGAGQASPLGSLNVTGTKYISGTTVSVNAVPAKGCKFDHWVVDGALLSSNPLALTMDANHAATPYFSRGNKLL